MPPVICLRCLVRQSLPPFSTPQAKAPHTLRNAFSTSPNLFKGRLSASQTPRKKSAPIRRPQAGGSPLLGRGKQSSGRGSSQGRGQGRQDADAAKAMRKRIVLSNTNAIEVPDLQELNAKNVAAPGSAGKVLALSNASIDALRAVEAFKHTQGWNVFRRPSTLVTSNAAELAGVIEAITKDKSTRSEIITGERNSGKSVLALQAMTFALQSGWVVIHIPEAQELTQGHTSYAPMRQSDGTTQYLQADYTALLLGRIAKAHAGLLSKLTLSREHNFPIPVQSNISLDRLAELGASDRGIAWPIFTALITEMLAPSTEAHPRPPILFSMDGLAHASTTTKYLTPELARIHAHDLALVSLFNAFFSGRVRLPNGGLVLGVDSASNRPSVPALDYAIQVAFEKQQQGQNRTPQLPPTQKATPPPPESSALYRPGNPVTPAATKQAFQHPYAPYDPRVTALLGPEGVHVRKVGGLTRDETRGVMQYYARSGIMRGVVDEQRVALEWTVAGGGVVGALEGALVRLRV